MAIKHELHLLLPHKICLKIRSTLKGRNLHLNTTQVVILAIPSFSKSSSRSPIVNNGIPIFFFIKTRPITLFILLPRWNSITTVLWFLTSILHLIYPFVNLLHLHLHHTPHLTHHGLHKHFRISQFCITFGNALTTILRHDCCKTKVRKKKKKKKK
jgi:hypothetical protein